MAKCAETHQPKHGAFAIAFHLICTAKSIPSGRREVTSTTAPSTQWSAALPPLPPPLGEVPSAHTGRRGLFARGIDTERAQGKRLPPHQARNASGRCPPLSVTAHAVPALPEGEPSFARYRYIAVKCGRARKNGVLQMQHSLFFRYRRPDRRAFRRRRRQS